jgi:hypothetical protein
MQNSESSAVAAKLPHNPIQRFRLRVDACMVARRGVEGRSGIKLAVMFIEFSNKKMRTEQTDQ